MLHLRVLKLLRRFAQLISTLTAVSKTVSDFLVSQMEMKNAVI